jgi:large subunit ribosomal protein L21
MFAVVSAGGKQYKVHEGDVLRIEKVTHEPGQEIELKPLLISDNDQMELSAEQLSKYQVMAKVLRTAKAKKIVVFTYRNKTNEHRRKGHRQFFSEVRIEKISRR